MRNSIRNRPWAQRPSTVSDVLHQPNGADDSSTYQRPIPSVDGADQTDSAVDADAPGASIDSPTGPTLTASSPPSMWASLEGVLPVVAFMVLNSVAGLGWAIGGATVVSLWSAISRRRRGVPIGRFLPIIMVIIIGRGAIGIITDSEAVYFGMGIASKFAIAAALAISVVIGKAVVGYLAPYVLGFDDATQQHNSYRSAMAHITIVGAIYYLISASFDIWLFNNASTNQYVLVRFIVNWGFTTAAVVGSAVYLNRRLQEIPGMPSLMTVVEDRITEQAAALGWDLSDDADSPSGASTQTDEAAETDGDQ